MAEPPRVRTVEETPGENGIETLVSSHAWQRHHPLGRRGGRPFGHGLLSSEHGQNGTNPRRRERIEELKRFARTE